MSTSTHTGFQKALAYTLGWEGGYSDHTDDRGGATRYGISEPMARRHGWEGPMDELTQEFAEEIYRTEFWDHRRLSCLELYERSAHLALRVFDWAVNSGPTDPARAVQRVLNRLNRKGRDYADLAVDGWIGTSTLRAIDGLAEARPENGLRYLVTGLIIEQGAHYGEITDRREANETFYAGWLNRLNLSARRPEVLDG